MHKKFAKQFLFMLHKRNINVKSLGKPQIRLINNSLIIFHTGGLFRKRYIKLFYAYGVMDIIIRNGHGDQSLNPGQDCLHYT